MDWAVGAVLPARVHGTRWAPFIPEHHIAGEHVPNRELAAHYASAGVVLNDHWESMADFGFLSNRIFDVLAAGGTLVSDSLPSIRRVFGDAVTEVDSAEALAAAVAHHAGRPVDPSRRRATSEWIASARSFTRRAEVIWRDIRGCLGLPVEGTAPPTTEDASRFRVSLLLQKGKRGPTSSGFIRLIAPLTTDLASDHLDIEVLDGVHDPRLADCDACIVQRVAVTTHAQAQELIATLRSNGIPLFVDTDDAFGELPDTHPEREAYRAGDRVLRLLMADARQVWFATGELMSLYPGCRGAVVPNNLDPRLWRNYREPPRKESAKGAPLRLLYMGTPTHDADFEVALAALDALWARRRRASGWRSSAHCAIRRRAPGSRRTRGRATHAAIRGSCAGSGSGDRSTSVWPLSRKTVSTPASPTSRCSTTVRWGWCRWSRTSPPTAPPRPAPAS